MKTEKKLRGAMVGLAGVGAVIGGICMTVTDPDFGLPQQFQCKKDNNSAYVAGNENRSSITLRQGFSRATIYNAAATGDALALYKTQAAQFCETGVVPKP